MNSLRNSPTTIPESLCTACGLCCNGAIFKKVELQSGDDGKALRQLGLDIRRNAKGNYFGQCCAAFAAGKCAIYDSRPAYCRQFECLVLKRLNSGQVTKAQAKRLVARAVSMVKRVSDLIMRLGNEEIGKSLQDRFEAVVSARARVQDRQRAILIAELTLAMHELNMLLHKEFYSGLAST